MWYLFRRKDGKIAVEYIAIIILALLILVLMMIFSVEIRSKILEEYQEIIDRVIKRR